MKTLRAPSCLLGLLDLVFLGYLAVSASQLPARIATHFNAQGQPDGWMSRSSHLMVMAVFGLAFPMFVVGIFYVIRFFPQGLNIPHRDDWLAPERQPETFGYFLCHSLWFACMAVCFVIGIHFLVIQANLPRPAHLSTPRMLLLAGAFLGGTVVWTVRLIRHFSVRPSLEKAHP